MGHAIYEFGVFLSKDLHGDDDLIIWAFFKMIAVHLASNPLTSGDFATSLANIKGEHIIYAFGVIFCKESNGEVVIVCCATYETQMCSPKPEPCKSFAYNNVSFSASEIVAPSSLQSWPKSSQSHLLQVSPTMLSHVWGWFPTFAAPIHVSTSPTLLFSGIIALPSCSLYACYVLMIMSW